MPRERALCTYKCKLEAANAILNAGASATSDSGSSEQSKRDEVIAPRKAKQKKPPPANEPSDTDEEMGENGEEGGEVDEYVEITHLQHGC